MTLSPKATLAVLASLMSLASWLARSPAASAASAYDDLILQDQPVLYFPMYATLRGAGEADLSGGGHLGRYLPRQRPPLRTRMPNGDIAVVLDGTSQYLQTASAPDLSPQPGSALTIEAWIRPDTLQFPTQESDGYVHWLGKGEAGRHEYVLRMYSLSNGALRPNRISGYVFNPAGGLGSGSYFQDPVAAGVWIHVALVIDRRGEGSVSIYKNGLHRMTTPFSQFDVEPQPGDAPLRIGTRDLRSFFKGAIGKVAVYDYALSGMQLQARVRAMGRL